MYPSKKMNEENNNNKTQLVIYSVLEPAAVWELDVSLASYAVEAVICY